MKLIRPKVKIEGPLINIIFFDIILQINIDIDSLSFKKSNESAFKQILYIGITSSDFQKGKMKKQNIIRPKARVKYFYSEDYVFGIDVSTKDNKVFFLCWLKKDYKQFRGGAFWKASYFSNSYLKQKEWCEFDLSIPKIVWPFGRFEPIGLPSPQKKITEVI